ncbi:hypothetical protein KJ819_00715 [Patescibacteria group bacterium]|nr:hypothetical protein [Patescibacteria group bacterium]MBU1500653.1 hypothetical protein [Patescibacteria group bacterium]MBU2080394.1 hypothetical protein [Patescibacteria group bacterium]MBU2124194.1 hypothetical protein [Patescibacteria group bacterium]MBU2194355.1 hypothetical protein [Patescibacteria group bacterium]
MPEELPESNDDTSTLERLRRKLYAQEAPETFTVPELAHEEVAQPGVSWSPPPVEDKKPRISWAVIFLIVAAVFFVLAVAGAAYFLIFGARAVSTDRVIISIDAPTAIASGDTVALLLSVQNNNPVPIHSTLIAVDFPETTRSAESMDTPLNHFEDTLGDIEPGKAGQQTIRAVLFGAENERVSIPLRFEYRVEGSNAVFVKETTYDVAITSSPLSVRAEAVTEATAGQPLTFAVTVRSNATTRVEHVAVLAQYPFGFTARKGEGPLFPIGSLDPGEEKTVAITGTLAGENSEQKVFRFTAGTRANADASLLAVSYTTTEAAVTLGKPFLNTSLSVNHDGGASPVVSAGSQAQGIISWANTLSTPILDGEILIKLSGAALDPSSVSAYGGFYRSSDTTLIFSKETNSELARLAPGATGNGSFTFATKNPAALTGVKNPTVTATVSVSGRRVGESNVPESVSSSLVRTIKVGTDLSLKARALYSIGAFKNTGPWPPVADTETTYTIELVLANTLNSVANASVSATLPSYVTYTGAVSPDDGSLTYNPTSRRVTWNAGEVPAGAGSRTMSFQVKLLPSVSQRGTSPILMSAQQITGTDRFTQKSISFTNPEVTTNTLADPQFQANSGTVR